MTLMPLVMVLNFNKDTSQNTLVVDDSDINDDDDECVQMLSFGLSR